MKVKTLKKAIEYLPDDSIVYVSQDAEGNGFMELSEEIDASGNAGAVILWPLHEHVDIDYGYCNPCDTEQIVVNGNCSVCGQHVIIKTISPRK